VKSLLDFFQDLNPGNQALPHDKELPLNDHHFPPKQEPKKFMKKKEYDSSKYIQKKVHNRKP
jgi:hypothetical protein